MVGNENTQHYLFSPPDTPALAVYGSSSLFPVNRIFCVGRNYAAHAKEMGMVVDRDAPFYFTKPANALASSGSTIPYPPGTENFHYEMEMVLALGSDAFRIEEGRALDCVYGYACGLDLTRRDLQATAREKGLPWDLSKAFEKSAILAPIVPASKVSHMNEARISLEVNGEVRQESNISELIWSVSELISHLSRYYHLQAGDLIFTGTPAGVGPLQSGDHLCGAVEGLIDVELTIDKPE